MRVLRTVLALSRVLSSGAVSSLLEFGLSPSGNDTCSVSKSSLSRDGTCEGTWRTREGAGVKKRLAGRTQHMMLCAAVQSDIPNCLVVHLPCTLTGRAALQRRQQSNITIADRGPADVAGAWNVSV